MALTKISRSLLDTGVSDSSDATAITIDSSENVGIGQGSPTQKLEVAGNIFVNTSGNPNLTVKTTGAGNNPNVRIQADSNYWDLQTLFSNTNNELDFRYNGTSKMIIDNSGNVGIGTTSPSALLQVNTPASGNHDAIIISRTTHGTVGTLQNSGGNLVVTSNKALTLGSDPTSFFTATSSLIKFEVDGSEKMRIDGSGNFLVGTTTSPASGNAKAVKYGIGIQGSSLSSSTAVTANTVTDMIDTASVVSSTSGAGMYLISIVRDGVSFGTHFVGIFGLSSGQVILYETLQTQAVTVTVSGSVVRASCGSSDTYLTNMIPLTINP